MSNKNTAAKDIQVESPAKEPVFAEDSAKTQNNNSKRIHQAAERAQDKLHNLEDQFVSLSSQRQLNFVLGSLILIAALVGPAGLLISLVIGTLMIMQAATGNMILNNWFDTMDTKHKKWLIPGLVGFVALMIIAYLVIGVTGGE